MLDAVLEDLGRIPGVLPMVARDPRLPPPAVACDTRYLREGDDVWAFWRQAIRDADAVLPIAPETGGLLERLTAMVLAEGRRLIGSSPEAVRVAASKLETARALAEAGLPVVDTIPSEDPWPRAPAGWVVKPDDGVGCEGCRHGIDPAVLRAALIPGAGRRWVVQPWVEGTPGSLTILAGGGKGLLLSANLQRLSSVDGRLRLDAVEVGGLGADPQALQDLASGIARAIPGLLGIVGADLILASTGPVLIEVNPRLTTSYAGLAAAIRGNPAELLLGLALEGVWPDGEVRTARGVTVRIPHGDEEPPMSGSIGAPAHLHV